MAGRSKARSGFAHRRIRAAGTLFWLQRQDYYDIRLSGPLGRGAARLTGRPGQVSLEVANQGRYEAPSPEALLEEQVGWKLPVSHLVWWVRGLPAPESKSRLSLNGDSRLATLEQDGWRVEYLRSNTSAMWNKAATGCPNASSCTAPTLTSRW